MNYEDLRKHRYGAALFDLDGVVMDTEPQYTKFWSIMGRQYCPEVPDLPYVIKGQTLKQISTFFKPEDLPAIQEKLDAYETTMEYVYVPGAYDYLRLLRSEGVPSILVTSSNLIKMAYVRRQHPELDGLFDQVLTSECFKASKPDPGCYILGCQAAGLKPEECLVFEDSFAGIAAGRGAGCMVAGIATTNAAESLAPLCDVVINDFTDLF